MAVIFIGTTKVISDIIRDDDPIPSDMLGAHIPISGQKAFDALKRHGHSGHYVRGSDVFVPVSPRDVNNRSVLSIIVWHAMD